MPPRTKTTFHGPCTFDGFKKWIEKQAEEKGGDGHFYNYEHKIAHNTCVKILPFEQGEEDVILIRFYGTVILEYWESGTVVMRTGGHRTQTTKERLNLFGPEHWYIYSDRNIWYVGLRGRDLKVRFDLVEGVPIPFATWEKGKSGLEI